MSKIVLITDTHNGVRGDSVLFHDNMKRFYQETFFPYLKKNKIETVIHCGDMNDKRKTTNTYSAQRLREDFLQPMHEAKIDFWAIVGNHDSFFRNHIQTNSINELIRNKYDNMKIITHASTFRMGGTLIMLVPWICKDNYEATMEAINTTKAKVCFGHLELAGFEMYKGQIMNEGMDPSVFKKFDVVASGHYHKRSKKGNVQYLGAAGQYRWDDYDCPRGFNVFDTETNKFTFVENPFKIFHKIYFEDDEKYTNLEKYKGKYVRILTIGKPNQIKLDRFMAEIEEHNPAELIYSESKATIDDGVEVSVEAEDTRTIFKKYIESMDNVDTKALNVLIDELYTEALEVE